MSLIKNQFKEKSFHPFHQTLQSDTFFINVQLFLYSVLFIVTSLFYESKKNKNKSCKNQLHYQFIYFHSKYLTVQFWHSLLD